MNQPKQVKGISTLPDAAKYLTLFSADINAYLQTEQDQTDETNRRRLAATRTIATTWLTTRSTATTTRRLRPMRANLSREITPLPVFL